MSSEVEVESENDNLETYSRRKIHETGIPTYFYLDLNIEYFENDSYPVNSEAFKMLILNSLKSLFGEVGISMNIDILKYEEKLNRALIRVPGSEFTKVRSALTLMSTFIGKDCCFRINKVSPYLISLSTNSRNYNHIVVK